MAAHHRWKNVGMAAAAGTLTNIFPFKERESRGAPQNKSLVETRPSHTGPLKEKKRSVRLQNGAAR